jgi:hypothetical protein
VVVGGGVGPCAEAAGHGDGFLVHPDDFVPVAPDSHAVACVDAGRAVAGGGAVDDPLVAVALPVGELVGDDGEPFGELVPEAPVAGVVVSTCRVSSCMTAIVRVCPSRLRVILFRSAVRVSIRFATGTGW